ncbi:MAG: hypothetical protein AAFY84_05790 [Pseudomonadota bacterium]
MAKLPFLRPGLEAILFGFERIGMIIRIAWLPLLLTFAVIAGMIGFFMVDTGAFDRVYEAMEVVAEEGEDGLETFEVELEDAFIDDAEFIGAYFVFNVVMMVVPLILMACVYVAVMRAATLAAYEPPTLPFYFALGGRELRYALVTLLLIVLVFVIMIAMFALIGGVTAGGAAIADTFGIVESPIFAAPMAAIVVAIVIAALIIGVRFLPVLPLAAIENRISFGDAWRLTSGNSFRLLIAGAFFLAMLQGTLFVVFLMVFIPTLIVLAIVGSLAAAISNILAGIVVFIGVLIAIAGFIGFAAFSVGAQSAFPGRVYAYLTNCGEDCKIY